MATAILNRAISVYSLPAELLSNLSVRSIEAQTSTAVNEEPETKRKNGNAVGASSTTLGCQTCPNASFETVEEQRAHFKSDWHRYNAKAKLTGRIVSQEEWDNMVEGVSSISGSASSSSSGDSSHSQSKVTRLLNRQKLNSASDGDSDEAAELADRQRRAHLRTAVIWFTPTTPIPLLSVPKNTQFGIHRALFPPFETARDYLEELRRMQLTGDEEEDQERRITLLMVAGGHFAGMVVGIKPRGKTERQDVKGAGEVRVLQHKTFHRYTTRKKQGGSQALNDNAKSKAVSAGAMLRRYGEQALQEEIQALMIEWAEDIHASERIFIRASTHGKKSFWGYEDAPIEKGDERIRTFPFPTRRPTLQELLRCWQELTRVKVSHLSEDALQALDEAYIASLQPKNKVVKPTPAPTPRPTTTPVPRISPEEEARQDRRKRLEEMIRKGKLDVLRPFWTKYKAEYPSSSEILGLASAAGQEDILRWLLEEERLDPTQPAPDGKFAYDLCSTKGARNVFRRIAHAHPDWCDWTAARVPSGLSEEMEAEQEKKKSERRKGLREKLREREKARAEEEKNEETSQPPPQLLVPVAAATGLNGPQKLGGRVGGEGGLAGLSPEMRQQIERERRARAAEARLK
ncbi:hypothetical protein IAR55_002413 [Kwoniella newhampshirensis]|uniref:VLRF1 domain-containing protein n=1 Tax=Kwoniella newhampshirensis TaxID=1651941 RepID=A0AAW0YQS5_9TREE